MKKLLLPLFGILLALSACDNELRINGPYEDIPIVYGLLNSTEPQQYIRIEKAFLPNDESALEVAQNPDSLYFSSALVELENLTTGTRGTMERIDAATVLGLPREEGVFATTPNYIYRINTADFPMSGGDSIRLTINTDDIDAPAEAFTKVLQPLEFPFQTSVPDVLAIGNWSATGRQNITVRFGPTAKILDAFAIVHYREREGNDPFEDRTLRYRITNEQPIATQGDNPNGIFGIQIDSPNFYAFLGENIPTNPNAERSFVGLDLEITVGGEEYAANRELLRVNRGLTSSEVPPQFNNITNGFGLFSSRGALNSGIVPINGESLDSLRNGVFTSDLGFR